MLPVSGDRWPVKAIELPLVEIPTAISPARPKAITWRANSRAFANAAGTSLGCLTTMPSAPSDRAAISPRPSPNSLGQPLPFFGLVIILPHLRMAGSENESEMTSGNQYRPPSLPPTGADDLADFGRAGEDHPGEQR